MTNSTGSVVVAETDWGPAAAIWRKAYGSRRMEYLYYLDVWAATIRTHPDWDHLQIQQYMLQVQDGYQKVMAGVTPATQFWSTVEEAAVRISAMLPEIEGVKPGAVAQWADWMLKTVVWPSVTVANQAAGLDFNLAVTDHYRDAEVANLSAAMASFTGDDQQQAEQRHSFRAFFSEFDKIDDATDPGAPITQAGVVSGGLTLPTMSIIIQPQPDGSLLLDSDAVTKAATQYFTDFNDSMNHAVAGSMDTLRSTMGALPGSLADLAGRKGTDVAAARQQANANATRYAGLAATAGAAWVDIVGTLVGYADPKLGHEITACGNAALRIGDAITKFSQTMSVLGAVDTLGQTLASAALTGNIVQAALGIISVFANTGPSPEEMILDQIGKLRDQVDQLHQEMNERFDSIDAKLNAIYTAVRGELHKIDLTLGWIEDTVDNIQRTLNETLAALHQFEAEMTRYLQDMSRVELYEAINGAVGYRQRTGTAMSYDQYVAWENVFYTWAVAVSKNSVEADTGLPTGNADAAAILASRTADSVVNYMNALLQVRGLPLLGDGTPLPNPRTYTTAARALALMAWENPELAAKIDPARLQTVRDVGDGLRAALAGFAAKGTAIVSGILDDYNTAAVALAQRIDTDRTAFCATTATALGWTASPPDFWTAQADTTDLGAAPVPLGAPLIPGNLQPPSNLRQCVPVAVLNTEWIAGVQSPSRLKVSLEGGWSDPKTTVHNPVRGPVSTTTGVVTATITVTYPGADGAPTVLWRRTVKGPRVDESIDWDPVAHFWTDFKAQFEASTAGDTLTADEQTRRSTLIAALSGQINTYLDERRAEFAAQTESRLVNAPYSDYLAAMSADSELLELVLSYGLPRAVFADDMMCALIHGDGRLPRSADIAAAWVATKSARSIPSEDLASTYTVLRDILLSHLEAVQAYQKTGPHMNDDPILCVTIGLVDGATAAAKAATCG